LQAAKQLEDAEEAIPEEEEEDIEAIIAEEFPVICSAVFVLSSVGSLVTVMRTSEFVIVVLFRPKKKCDKILITVSMQHHKDT